MKILIGALLMVSSCIFAKDQSFMLLGDLHYDRWQLHNIDWVKEHNFTKEIDGYCKSTAENWNAFFKILKDKAENNKPEIDAIVQLGDTCEGLAGDSLKAEEMAKEVIQKLEEVNFKAPWILAKGNHDITGEGAKEAFDKHYIGFIQKQLSDKSIKSANYKTQIGDNLFVCLDPWDNTQDTLNILEKNLKSSTAKNKFVLVHEPIIPVNLRCWHLYRKSPEKRDALLRIIAENKAIILSAHLHIFAVVKEKIEYGNLVQVSICSVIKDINKKPSKKFDTEYGSRFVSEDKTNWEPKSKEERIGYLNAESDFVKFYKSQSSAGYSIITTKDNGDVIFSYYLPSSPDAVAEINLSDLLNN